jgi:hypothetical protein
MVLRVVLVLVVTLLAGGGLVACSTTPETGDCVEKTGDSYSTADCGTASLRVHERVAFEGVGEAAPTDECIDVAGVTETYSDFGSGTVLCIGPRDVDPAAAINLARMGDCVAGVTADLAVRRVDCADPAAESVVVSRIEGTVNTTVGDLCETVPGATSSYSWSLVNNDNLHGVTSLGGDVLVDLHFCLGPVGVDPAASPDAAQVGDCLAETSGYPGYAKVGCGAPDAAYRVVDRISKPDNYSVAEWCAVFEEATSGFEHRRGDFVGYFFCLAPN